MDRSTSRSFFLRQTFRVVGVGATVASGFLLYRQQAVQGFLLAFIGLSFVVLAESDIDFGERTAWKSLGELLTRRSYMSTLGQLCNIASYFCLAAALISWIALR